MTDPLTTQQIVTSLNGRVRFENTAGAGAEDPILKAVVASQDVPVVVQEVLDELNGRFITSVGIDRRERTGRFEVNYLFGLDREKRFLVLRSEVDPTVATIPSITPLIPGANWAEREVRDMIGVTPIGHPDPRRLVLPDDWPENLHPLRRDFHFNERPPSNPSGKPPLKPLPPDTSLLPIGPFFPTLEEPVSINLYVRGEHIVDMDYRGFFNHRGIEKMADSELTYHQVPYIAERICGICGLVHSGCFCQAVEAAAGIEIPERARYIRTLLYEIERIHSHLLWIGLACHFIAFDTLFMQAWRIREPVMWLSEYLTGNRKTYGIACIGGITRDLPEDARERILPVINKIETETLAAVDAILGDGSLRARLQNSGILSAENAKAYCVVGPTARGSGVDIDARRDHPYAAYPDLDFEVCVENSCDNWGRTMVRIRELLESIKLVRQVLQKLPGGPIVADLHEIKADRVGVSSVEAPRGEVHHYILTGQGQRPYRWRVRAPSYNNLQSIPVLLQGMTIADAPISVGSLDPCFSCTERISVIDKDSGEARIYRQEELLKLKKG
jgi:Ni,Fe-hydrogenase III large subunit/Ni,Fe-hydrogenase III component G